MDFNKFEFDWAEIELIQRANKIGKTWEKLLNLWISEKMALNRNDQTWI